MVIFISSCWVVMVLGVWVGLVPVGWADCMMAVAMSMAAWLVRWSPSCWMRFLFCSMNCVEMMF